MHLTTVTTKLGWFKAAFITCCLTFVSGCSTGQNLDVSPRGITVSRVTTHINQTNILGYKRNPAASCAQDSTDPQSLKPHRIVLTDPVFLDDLCALGLQKFVVATSGNPEDAVYLGAQLDHLPSLGPVHALDVKRIKAAHPTLILTTSAQPALATIAPTVTLSSTDWQQRFRQLGAVFHQSAAVNRQLSDLKNFMHDTALRWDTAHSQVSLLCFTDNNLEIVGTASFAGKVLAASHIQRPSSQSGPDSYRITTPDGRIDGDVIYIGINDTTGRQRADQVMNSQSWYAAARGRRYIVNHALWFGSINGVIAARYIVQDVRESINQRF